jgi:hypothetical protein
MTAEKIALVSLQDKSSFLLPVFGFGSRADAEAYIEQATADGAAQFAFGERFEPLHTNARSYVPIIGARHDDWETNRMFGFPLSTKPIWPKLREKTQEKARGSYNLALMVGGVRSFFRHVEHRARTPSYMYRIAEGSRDCYAVWSGLDGRDLHPIRKNGTGQPADAPSGQSVFAARSGRGVLYTRVANFNTAGVKTGVTVQVVQVEFSIFDRDITRDDVMRVTVLRQFAHSRNADETPSVSTEHMDGTWKALVERAENGFNRWCREEPADVEEWRTMFFAQKAKALADLELSRSANSADSFRGRVKSMDWQAALAEVQEAWQLQVVVDVHCDSKFDDSPHRHDSSGHRVGVMLSRIDDGERRAALSKMVSDFVAPCDKLWSYTGD